MPPVEWLCVAGGSGKYVLATIGAGSELVVFMREGAELREIHRTSIENGWRCYCDAVDWQCARWIVAEAPNQVGRPESGRVRVYDVPSLRVVRELPGNAFSRSQRGIACVSEQSWLLAVDSTGEILRVFDLGSGKEVAHALLRRPDVPEGDEWRPFGDRVGRFVGVRGSQWVQLFSASTGPGAAK